MTSQRAIQRRRRDQLVASVHRATTPGDVFDRASPLLRRLVPFDAAAWLGTDPQTGWPTSPTRTENLESMTTPVARSCGRRSWSATTSTCCAISKAIFAKVGVSSRGELVAKPFSDFFALTTATTSPGSPPLRSVLRSPTHPPATA